MTKASQLDTLSSFVLRPSSFNLVTCVYDSLNYLLDERELAACFEGSGARAGAGRPAGGRYEYAPFSGARLGHL